MPPILRANPTTVSLSDLHSNNIPFSTLLEAFGPASLGILLVKDLPPQFPSLRSKVLANSSRLASLPASTLQSLTNPSAKYLVGWSHGVETLREGVVDTAKGSFYVNCAFYQDKDKQGADAKGWEGFEEYTAGNVWPPEEEQEGGIPGFRRDAEELIRLVIDTAVLVARACDRFAEREVEGYERGYLERVVAGSDTSKARLLHYFPQDGGSGASSNASRDGSAEGKDGADGEEDGDEDDWCATHLDHGCLTGLTSAQFLDEASAGDDLEGAELPQSPSPKAGLYIRSRDGTTYKVAIPRDCLAFQTGEALELITGGKFKAVPHFVKGVDVRDLDGEDAKKMRVARNTLAVFTQPGLGEVVDLKTGLTFGEFARGVVRKNTT